MSTAPPPTKQVPEWNDGTGTQVVGQQGIEPQQQQQQQYANQYPQVQPPAYQNQQPQQQYYTQQQQPQQQYAQQQQQPQVMYAQQQPVYYAQQQPTTVYVTTAPTVGYWIHPRWVYTLRWTVCLGIVCTIFWIASGADYKWSRRTTSSYYGYYYYCDEEVYMGPWKACISSCGLDSCDTIRPSDATGEFASLGYVRFAIITVMLLEIFNWFPLLVWYRACLRTQPMYSWISSADAALDRLPKWNELATFKILMGFQTSIFLLAISVIFVSIDAFDFKTMKPAGSYVFWIITFIIFIVRLILFGWVHKVHANPLYNPPQIQTQVPAVAVMQPGVVMQPQQMYMQQPATQQQQQQVPMATAVAQ